MDPMSMLGGGKLSIQGGDAAPSSAYSGDPKQTVNSWLASSFAVGSSPKATNSGATNAGGGFGGEYPSDPTSEAMRLAPMVIMAVVAVVVARAI